MKRFLFVVFFISTLLTAVLGCQNNNGIKDLKTVEEITAAHPDKVRILFENNYVVVLEYKLQPGDKIPLHQLGNRTIYALTGSEINFHLVQNDDIKKSAENDTYWQEAGVLSPENVSQAEARLLVVARTEALLPGFALEDLEQDVSQTSPEIAKLLLDNDYIRVIEVYLEPGEEIKTHRGISRVVYSLVPYKIDYVTEETDVSGQKTFEAGHTHWHQSGSHSLVNIGGTPMHDLIFEFKK
ncbi:MAG: hypothetical protein ACOYVF_01545 [Candidatus Zixiibacteriota bacterium]